MTLKLIALFVRLFADQKIFLLIYKTLSRSRKLISFWREHRVLVAASSADLNLTSDRRTKNSELS